MEKETIIRVAGSQKLGTFIRCKTKTEPTLKAVSKRNGIVVEKIVDKTIRLGCNYNNMKAVIEAKENGRGTREMYEKPIIENLIYENIKTGQIYLRYGNVPNANTKTVWLINGKVSTLEEVKDHVIASYFGDKKSIPEVQNVKIENVLALGDAV